MSKKTKVTLISIASVIVFLGVAAGVFFLFKDKLFPEPTTPAVDFTKVKVDMDGKYYVGNLSYDGENAERNTVALDKLFPDFGTNAKYAFDDNSVFEIASDTDLKILSAGQANLKITVEKTVTSLTLIAVDAVNAFDNMQFMYAFSQHKAVVLHKDISLIDTAEEEYSSYMDGNNKYGVYANMYGNGHIIDCSPVIGNDSKPWFDPAFKVRASGVRVQDTHFTGMTLKDGQTVQLSELVSKGVLFDSEGTDSFVKPEVELVNCVFENANRLTHFISSEITIEKCVFRNAGEACVSIGTYETGGSTISLKDCTLGLAGLAAVSVYDGDKGSGTQNKATINLEGEIKIYNWKSIDEINLIPSYELLASIMNPRIRSTLKKEDDSFFVKNEAGERMLHLGILFVVSGDYLPQLNGAADNGLTERTINNYVLYGYAGQDPKISPDEN